MFHCHAVWRAVTIRFNHLAGIVTGEHVRLPAPAVNRPPSSFRGARHPNLKNIGVTLPTGKLIIVTGVSGSDRSSLAFDTIYAGGQRRYVGSLSAYARQFSNGWKPDVDRIEASRRRLRFVRRTPFGTRSPRSATTEIHDCTACCFARVGRTFCRKCGRQVVRETAEVVASELSI